MRSGPITQFQSHSQFRNLQEFNHHMEAFLFEHKGDFTKSELICLKTLIRFCAKVAGVSNASIATLLKAAKSKFGPVSESTFHRMRRKAVQLGILQVHATERKNHSQSSNLWVFQRWMNDTPTPASKPAEPAPQQETIVTQMTSPQTSTLIKTNQSLKTRSLHDVPASFISYAKAIWNDPCMIKEGYRVVQLSTKFYFHFTEENRAQLGRQALSILFRKLKSGKRIERIFGYYWGIVNRLLDEQYFEVLDEAGYEKECVCFSGHLHPFLA
ncbi:hypothetical protein [Bacillus sp. REN10]|uniref:hypothetical protein n=1 Tax=Bacillus sp. REN10 TaxID=2782541 RepID=UPI00193B393B|nr:hypothetical protein [Bacillus sp. REN10]